jgi:hypothetical protein
MLTAVHEMGHYYIMKIRGIATSGMWFNEMGTDYLTYNYFKKSNEKYFANAQPFFQFMIQNYTPKYRELISWDTLHINMPSQATEYNINCINFTQLRFG